jgi:adenylate cyclase
MICDLRDFTEISNLWPRDDVIEMLNGYFDAVSGPIEENGGEILKFMGDGLLAVFPLSDQTAPHRLLKAVAEAKLNMAALNETHRHKNRPLLRCGMGVHVGDIMYGNIGSKTRLDFTAIGPAVNVAGRLEALTKAVGRPVLMSEAFVKLSGDGAEFDNLGNYELKGLNEPVAVYALSEELSRQRPELLVAGL